MDHRGPDDSGFYVKDNIGLGHRRLSIIDLSHGHQPMFDEDGSLSVVYNGEIYNYKEIKDVLVSKGHVFKTDCDTEVIIHAYEEWGAECVKQFNGMFAFLLWDSRKQRIWIVRDRLGIKPLYYYKDGEKLIASSEIKAILAFGQVNPELNGQVLDAYFSLGYVPGPQTMFKNILKLEPGHFLIAEKDNLKNIEYWDFADIRAQDISFDRAKESTERLLKDSVKKRLMSDVSLGAFLSGGIDSSAVVALMSELIDKPVKTFTVSYDKKYKVGEEEFAQKVAEKFNTEHHEFKLEPDDFFGSLEKLIDFAEEPIVEPAAIALYHISKLARENAVVLLSGEGSDEIFGGYYLYDVINKLNKAQKMAPRFIRRTAGILRVLSNDLKFQKYLDWFIEPAKLGYMGTSNYLTNSLKKDFYSPDFLSGKSNYLKRTFSGYFSRVKNKSDFINKLLYVDTKTWLADDLLVKADKMTMAASVELRVPFLDHRLVEHAAGLPGKFKINSGQGKFILKKIMEKCLPNEIIYRKKKGFPVPTRNWFGQDIFPRIRERINDNFRDLPWLNKNFIERLLTEQNQAKADHSKLLMMLLVLITWKERFKI